MKEVNIEDKLIKINRKLIQSLDPTDRQQIISQFKQLYEKQMNKASLKLLKTSKVHTNLINLQNQQEILQKSIQANLKERMQIHSNKRDKYQLQKLKNYRNMQMQWKDKLRTIGEQIKQKQKESIILSNRLSKQALNFWQNKEKNMKKITPNKHESRYFSQQNHTNQKDYNQPSSFITQSVNFNSNEQNYQNPQQNRRLKTQIINSRSLAIGPKSIIINKPKSQQIRQHLIQSSKLWQEKDEINFQKLMQKMQRIQKTRRKLKQKTKELKESNRYQSQTRTRQINRYNSQSKDEKPIKTIKDTSLKIFFRPQQNNKRQKQQQRKQLIRSRVQKRRQQLFNIQFQGRSNHFQQQTRKLLKGQSRKLVKQTINQLKFQALNKRI